MSIIALKQMKAKRIEKVDVASLTRDMFNDKNILERYFKYDNRHLTRFHIPLLTKEEYEQEIKRYTGNIAENNANYDTATSYFIQKMTKERVARDLGYNVKKMDFSSYPWNDDYFITDDLIISSMYVDNKFMEEPEEKPTAYDVYIKFDTHQSVLDEKLFEKLYEFCWKALRDRKAMLLMRVEQCVSVISNVFEQTNGFSMNTSGTSLKILQGYRDFFDSLAQDWKYTEFLNNNNDITVYANDSTTHSDYIDTYARLVKKLVGIKSEDTYMEDYLRSVLYNPDDDYIDEIIEHCFMESDKPMRYVDEMESED